MTLELIIHNSLLSLCFNNSYELICLVNHLPNISLCTNVLPLANAPALHV